MKQQILNRVSSIVILPLVLGLLSGCVHKTNLVGAKTGAPQATRIAVMVHGPFALIVKEHGVAELMPRDEKGQHELVYPYPVHHDPQQQSGCKITTEFELTGVDSADDTVIDKAFLPVTFPGDGWKQTDHDLFVTMKLPRPRRIDGVGLYAATFAGDPARVEYIPLTQILEFTARDPESVHLVRTEIKRCGNDKPSQTVDSLRPMPCSELQQKYEDYFNSTRDPAENKDESERPFLRDELRRCIDNPRFFFVGVGLHYSYEYSYLEQHGRDFFNQKLLPLASGGRDKVDPRRKLIQAKSHSPGDRQDTTRPMLHQTVYKGQAPRLVLVTGGENCTALPTVVH